MRHDLASERVDYEAGVLDEATAGNDPIDLFGRWLADAIERRDQVGDLPEPSAMVLSTIDLTGGVARPRSRTVLLKQADEQGLVFFTNYQSDKAQQLEPTPWVSLLFAWTAMERQVRIDGSVTRLDAEASDAYFAERPRGSQLGAWASQQSRPVESRASLDAQYRQVEQRFGDEPVPRPPHWGGYRVVPDRIEFWQGRHGRLHDRLNFVRPLPDGDWQRVRLQP